MMFCFELVKETLVDLIHKFSSMIRNHGFCTAVSNDKKQKFINRYLTIEYSKLIVETSDIINKYIYLTISYTCISFGTKIESLLQLSYQRGQLPVAT